MPTILGIIGFCFIVWFTSKHNHQVKMFTALQAAEQHVNLILSIKAIIEQDRLKDVQNVSREEYSKELAKQLITQIQVTLNESDIPLFVYIYNDIPNDQSIDQDIKKAYNQISKDPRSVFTTTSQINDEKIYRYAVNINSKNQPVSILEIRIPLDQIEQHSHQHLIQLIVALSIFGAIVLYILYITLRGLKWQQSIQTNELELKVQERTKILAEQNQQLEETMTHLKDAQHQLILQEKMASIGVLTAGIAHEIKNPLNFINNFSDMTVEMLDELKEEIEQLKEIPQDAKEIIEGIIEDIAVNCNKINEHGKRAESTVKNMLIQSRQQDDQAEPTDVNKLVDEYLNLAYHGMRAQDTDFNIKMVKELDPNLPQVKLSQQNMGRVILNIINNGLYAANDKKTTGKDIPEDFMPTITVSTRADEKYVYISIKDNGSGISEAGLKKIFEPFFTTKPAGVGTGLGLPICYEIVVEDHKGELTVKSELNKWTEFTIHLPLN